MIEADSPEAGHPARPVDPIHCFRCGICCVKYQVRLGLLEARRICDGLEMPWVEFSNRYLDRYYFGGGTFLIRRNHEGCVFLRDAGDRTTYCAIEMFKPLSCIEWSPGLDRRECREGLQKRWGLIVGDEYQLIGTEERLRDFFHLLEKLKGTPVGTE